MVLASEATMALLPDSRSSLYPPSYWQGALDHMARWWGTSRESQRA